MLDCLPEEAIDAAFEHVGEGVDTPLLTFEIRHLGGALGRPGTHLSGAGR